MSSDPTFIALDDACADIDAVPLVVDVDGTLLRTDILHEAALQFVARHPLQMLKLVGWLARGKAVLKARLADRIDPVIETMPLRLEVLALIREAQAEERPVYLASASDRRCVDRLANRIGGIAGVFASDASTNLAGRAKAERLGIAFGTGGYDYIGDTPVDMPVWAGARRALAVVRSHAFEVQVKRVFPDAEIVCRAEPVLKPSIRALRTHQWSKNLLLFLPLVAGHRFDDQTILATTLGFLCFCMAASSAYILNDLLDLPGDRDHPRKARRPFAAGDLPIGQGLLLSLTLMAAALLLATLLPTRFLVVLGVYIGITIAYSMVLKRKVIVDVITLGGLYTLRVLGGLAATEARHTQWLLMFSLFLFLSLAVVKRCSELIQRRDAGQLTTNGRGYYVGDIAVLFPLAAAAAYGAVFVVTLYMSSPEVMILYSHPNRMWLICPLLIYWISRVLILTNRGGLHHDPVIFAMTDKVSWVTGACVIVVVGVSI